jgi:hypothetical protein
MTDKEIERLRRITNFETGLVLRQAKAVEREVRTLAGLNDAADEARAFNQDRTRQRRTHHQLTSATILQFTPRTRRP